MNNSHSTARSLVLAVAAVAEVAAWLIHSQYFSRILTNAVGLSGFLLLLTGGAAGGGAICEFGNHLLPGSPQPWYSRSKGGLLLVAFLAIAAVVIPFVCGVALRPFGLAGTPLQFANAAHVLAAMFLAIALWPPRPVSQESDESAEPSYPPYIPPPTPYVPPAPTYYAPPSAPPSPTPRNISTLADPEPSPPPRPSVRPAVKPFLNDRTSR